jgi:hypothetical protein
MPEVWLETNRRPLRIAMAVASVIVVAGGALAWFFSGAGGTSLGFVAGVALAAAGVVCLTALAWAGRIPRLAYDDGWLLVYLRSLRPLRVPIDAVEVFFLGQGPAHPADADAPVPKAANVIVRIAESASDYHARDVRGDLGQWRDGYITIRGMWCEPLSHERVNELNRRLHAAHRARRKEEPVT